MNCNEADQICRPDSSPTMTSYCNYLYEIARLIRQLHDATVRSNTMYTKYEQVLYYDEQMRKLATAYIPTFLKSSTQLSEVWPVYVPWGRRSLAICAAHKIIMIHRKFLSRSFTNSAFSFTRKTCIAACKTILKEATSAVDDNGPVLWIDQAFTVTSGIILVLDSFHRSSNEPEHAEHLGLANQAIRYLRQFELNDNMIAIRGAKLLSFLVGELDDQLGSNTQPHNASIPRRKRIREGEDQESRTKRQAKSFNLNGFLHALSSNTDILPSTPAIGQTETASDIAWDAFDDLLPPQTGFGGDHLFDDFFSFTM
jgi:hypothetical protein